VSFTVVASVHIRAPIEIVWQTLTDLAAWSAWCTWLRYDGGALRVGERLQLRLEPPEGGGYAFAPEVLILDAPLHLAWVGRTGLPGVFDGEHHFKLRAVEGGTWLENSERYSGLLSPLFERLPQMRGAQAGFEALNAEIKARAETLARP
jgi:hypothetical protein